MRLACPSCAAEYEVPASRMTTRRMVRCERCGNEWIAVQETEESAAVAEPYDAGPGAADPKEEAISLPIPTDVAAVDRLALPVLPGARDVGLLAAWIASVVLLAGAATGIIVWRSDVVRAWPASARLLGLPAVVAAPGHGPGGTAAKTAEKPARHE